jgi:hypothetical protein
MSSGVYLDKDEKQKADDKRMDEKKMKKIGEYGSTQKK